ncbi:hypothetical protein [Microbacterium sp.]|jgi:hypothetical protein|uniref:WD40/YVTN/BNR-like repeat-containing protein n=2 Tax=unclassified Microbacterium TaxID=2609290 RepID=UPI002720BC58|nr:hypothetical protein [Microbacterium sp.]MDO8384428.1 hypothetical protein [Microbacterium sp.]
MNTRTRTLTATVLAGVLTVTATACTTAGSDEPSSAPPVAHIHDVAFAPDGAVLVGAHTGAYRIDLTTDEVSLVGDTVFDAMGLTVQGESILASGHPAPDNQEDSFAPPNIGLVRHTETGWEQVSLAGVTDFHMLATTPAAPDFLLGLPSDRAALAASVDGGQTWADVAALTARDISIDPTNPDVVTATTPEGLMVSRDAGSSFAPVGNAPMLVVIAADPTQEEGIIGAGADGTIWTGTTKPGAVWKTAGHATGIPAAISVSPDGTAAIADDSGVRITTDAGNTWRTVLVTEPTS